MKLGSTLLLALTIAAAVAGCGSAEPGQRRVSATEPCTRIDQSLYPPESTVGRLRTEGRVRVAVRFDAPGLGYKDPETGKLTGFDIEIAQIVACQLGIGPDRITWVEATPDKREELITTGAVDFVVASYAISAERKQLVSFAGPYLLDGQVLLVRKGRSKIDGPEATRGRRVCAPAGSTSLDSIQRYGADAVVAGGYPDCVTLLQAGKVEAVVGLNAVITSLARMHGGDLATVGQQFRLLQYGIGLPRSDATFRRFLNDVLQHAVDDGSWRRAYEATLGRNGLPTPLPPSIHRY